MRRAALAAAATLAWALVAVPASAPEAAVRLRMASTFPGGMALLGEGAGRLAQKIARASGGELVIEPRETIAEGEAARGKAIGELRGRGVQVRRWSPNFRWIYGSYAEFRASYAVWSYLGYLQ